MNGSAHINTSSLQNYNNLVIKSYLPLVNSGIIVTYGFTFVLQITCVGLMIIDKFETLVSGFEPLLALIDDNHCFITRLQKKNSNNDSIWLLVMFIVHIVIKVENNGNCNSAVH
jgi:hypothetical protein